MKTVAFSAMAIVFVMGAWGYSYYTEIHVPGVSAQALLPLYPTIPDVIANLHAFSPVNEMDFEKAEDLLKEQCKRLHAAKQELARVPHSDDMEAIRQYFDETLDVLEKACSEARRRIEQVGGLINFFAEFEKVFTTMEQSSPNRPGQEENSATGQIRTIGDLQEVWGGQIRAASQAGDKAFRNTLEGTGEKTGLTLTKEWGQIQPNLATMTSVLEHLNVPPSLPLEEATKRILPSTLQSAEKAMHELGESRKIIEKIRSEPEFAVSALDIVNFRSLTSVSQTEISEHLMRLDSAMKALGMRFK